MSRCANSTASLYDFLAEPAPATRSAGRTIITKQKETVDNDVETFALESVMERD